MSKYSRPPDVIETDLGAELVLLDPRNGEMFGLNACARRVWLDLPHFSPDDIAERLASDFTVEHARARADVASLLDALVGAGLLVQVRLEASEE